MAAVSVKDRIPPHNDDAERAVIGAMLIDEAAISIALQFLHPEDFYSPRHRRIFDAILSLFNKGARADLLTLNDELERTGKLEEAGGADYIAGLTHAVPSSANTEYYAQIVQNCSLRRNLIRIAGDAGAKAYDETLQPRLLLEETQQHLFLANDPRKLFQYKKSENVARNVVKYIEEIFKTKPEYTGIPTGFAALDRMTAGFQPAELIVIGARPGVGKTAMALSMAANMSIRMGRGVAFFSLEMSDHSLMMRLISAEAQIDHQRLRTGHFPRSDFKKILDAADEISEARLFIEDMPRQTMLNIQSMARMLRQQEKVDIIFIDYIGLIASDNNQIPRWEQISQVSRSLKGLARELSIPIVALSQLRRDAETKKPTLADIRESGSIEQDADLVMFLNRDRELGKTQEEQLKSEPGQKVELIVAKNRNGQTGKVELNFLKYFTKFVPFQDVH